jgi:perosamine synthetase
MSNRVIRTKRLLLRKFTLEDITEGYILALNDCEVVKHLNVRDKKWNQRSVEAYVKDSHVVGLREFWGIFLTTSEEHIGNIRLHFSEENQSVGLAIMIWNKQQWNKGYATEALDKLSEDVLEIRGYHKITAGIYSVNVGALKVFERCGFVCEGVLRDYTKVDKVWVDDVLVARIRSNSRDKKSVIPSAGPSVTNADIRMVLESVQTGWGKNMSQHLDQFTEEFKVYTGKRYCLPVSHCTAAIHLAMIALDVGPGDEVIVPDITWVASAAPAHHLGATPVFVDINRDDWCLSPQSFKKAITKKTKAVVVVGLLGNMPRQMDQILKIARDHKVAVIEDAAESVGASYKNRRAGCFGDIGVFSLNGTKLIVAGQGGVFVTNNKRYYEKAKLFMHHGIDREREGKYYWSYEIGYNYQWTNMQAAMGVAQLRRIDELVAKKRQIGRWYKERLKGIHGIELNYEADEIQNTFWIVTAILDPKFKKKKEQIVEEAKRYNVDIRPFFYPISSMPPYKQYCGKRNMKMENTVAYGISPYGICLPSAFSATEAQVDIVCQSLKKILNIE